MPRLAISAVALIFAVIVTVDGCMSRNDRSERMETVQIEQPITPEQARAALLELKSIRVITGDEDDPILKDLRSATIARTNESRITIGRFISCNLKERTWQMSVGNPEIHFHATINGNFEPQSDGTWRAIRTGGSIT
jgi:hypothetical protein